MKNVASIGTCPICGQGRLLIAREKRTGVCYILCEDCESEWKEPNASNHVISATRDEFGESEFLSREEAAEHSWKGFIK